MAVFDQAGGGGPVRDITDSDLCGIDKPFDLFGSNFNAQTAEQINQMFDMLFKCAIRLEDAVTVLQNADPSTSQRITALSSGQISVLSTTPIIAIPGVPGRIIVPWLRVIEADTTGIASPGTLWQTVYSNLTSDLIFPSVNTDFNNARQKHFISAAVTTITDNTSIIGKDVMITLSADPTGTHSANVTHFYTLLKPTVVV